MKTTCIIAAMLVCASSQAWAVRVATEVTPGADGLAAPPGALGAAAAASHADDSSSLRQGMITSVSAKNDQIEVNGSWLKIASGKTRLFQRGQAVSGDALAKGQVVKFTLLPGAVDRFTLGVVYVP
ncbi:MAG: hypothetical protein H7274_12965 [Rhodoferax sp.]|nr:hypothetical protein [Rhodoferax sp.]